MGNLSAIELTASGNFPYLLGLPFILLVMSFVLFFFRKTDKGIINFLLVLTGLIIGIPFIFNIYPGFSHPFTQTFEWFNFGKGVDISVGLDGQGSLMLVLVFLITFLVILYSTSYMKEDEDYGRYFASLLFFAAAMLGIIISFNLLLTFVFWELVGFSSFLLINHWYKKPLTSDAAKKAFIVNRIGDMGFVLSLGLVYSEFGTFEIETIISIIKTGTFSETVLFWIGFGILLGCIGKSAQFPLMVWLPDAMQAPTPVSALLHAATMVAAGVFLLARIFPLLHPELLTIIAYVGGITSFFGAFAAATQTDIKKILAYSTISQLGYMMSALGAHSYLAPLLHLFTHALFKASLFLCAGAIIHSLTHLKEQISTSTSSVNFDPQDIRLMGGLRKRMPFTFLAFALASMAGAGVPLTAGFLSKDEILAVIVSWSFNQENHVHFILPVLIFSTSLMTAFYLGRMFFLIFFGGFRLGNVYPELKGYSKYIHEAPLRMLFSYGLLSIMCLFIFFSFNPLDPDKSWIFNYLSHPVSVFNGETALVNKINHTQELLHNWIISISVVVLSLGFALSYFLYGFKTRYKKDFLRLNIILTLPAKISYNAFFVDTIYHKVLIIPYFIFANGISKFEKNVINTFVDNGSLTIAVFANIISWIDKYLVDGTVNILMIILNGISGQLKHLQNGKIQSYLVGAILAIIIVGVWLLL
ncbi:MAG: NADH-quinone oxidoreductase subunit L [Opitutaceae bacterium]|nr:NADH-quinone oxidoreductase subunit L [Cytophagales bacterium]